MKVPVVKNVVKDKAGDNVVEDKDLDDEDRKK